MNVDINAFGGKLFNFTRTPHPNAALSEIKNGLKKIFEEYGVNDSNFNLIGIAVSGSSMGVTNKNVSTYIDKISRKIVKNNSKEQNLSEEDKRKKQEEKEQQETQEKGAKFKFSVSSEDVRNLSSKELAQKMINKMILQGVTEEDLNRPMKGAAFEHMDFSMEKVDFPDGTTLRDTIYFNATKLKELENEKLKAQGKNELTSEELTSEDKNSINNSVNDKDEVSKDKQINNEDALTEEDLQEINDFGIEGITTHSQLQEFRKSEEYELIQNMQSMALSRGDDETE